MGILDGSRVELTEVNAKTQAAVLLPHHDYWRSPWAVGGSNDITRQHLLHLCHFFPPNCRILPPVWLAERRPMSLNPMLQQRSIAQVFISLAEDIHILLKKLVELLLLKRGEILWYRRLARGRRRMHRGGRSRSGCLCELDHLKNAYTLPCLKLKGLRPVIMHGIPYLWTTRERRNAGHKRRESVIRAK